LHPLDAADLEGAIANLTHLLARADDHAVAAELVRERDHLRQELHQVLERDP
jgi:hypothetical protein